MSIKQVLSAGAIAICLSVGGSTGCAGRKAAWEKGQTSNGQSTGDTSAQIAEGDAHWAKRTDANEIRAAIAAWEKAAQADPKNLDLLVKLTRANYFLADGFLRKNDKEYLKYMDIGVKWGEKAMQAASPEFDKKMREGAKLPDAVVLIPKEGVPAMYWYASSLGKWAKRKSFAVLLGQKDNVRAIMTRVLELEPNYYHGGPHRYFGVFYAVAPAFAGGDLKKSKEHFEKSLQIAPTYVGTKVLWAEELAVKEQDEATFDKLLNEVLAAPDDVLPELMPEVKVEKEKARELLADKDDRF
jgi:tetratricopeptide (TPR) repeat protein